MSDISEAYTEGMDTMEIPNPVIRKVIAELLPGGGVMAIDLRDGQLSEHAGPKDLVRSIRRQDKKEGSGFDVTLIEWRNVPEGWVAPE